MTTVPRTFVDSLIESAAEPRDLGGAGPQRALAPSLTCRSLRSHLELVKDPGCMDVRKAPDRSWPFSGSRSQV